MVHFLYSDEHIKEQNNILKKCGKKFVPGVVTVQGKRQSFTNISNKPTISRFIDTKIVASFNDISEATYIPTSKETVRGE